MIYIATFQGILSNLGVKLIITETSQNISNNTTTISYSARVYKVSTHNPWNNFTQTPFRLVINGETIYNQNANYDLRDWTASSRLSRTEQVITSGTRVITHGTDGVKTISASWSANFASTGFNYGSVLASGNMALSSIPRVSKPTLSKTTFNFGESVTLTTNRASTGFLHTVSYVANKVEYPLSSDVGANTSISIPVSRLSSLPNSSSETILIRVKTLNGSTEVGSSDISVTVNVPDSIVPTVDGVTVSETVTRANIFLKNNENYIKGISKVKTTATNAKGVYGSSVVKYEFKLKDSNAYSGSSTVNSFTFGAFNIPSSGSAIYRMQCRVQDSRGRYSTWVDSSDIRFYHYSPPTIASPGLDRDGTTLSVKRTYSVQSIVENGIERNLGNLSFQTRTKGSNSWGANSGAKHSGMSLSNEYGDLSGIFLDNVAYEVQAILSDKLEAVYSAIATAGASFVTMEVLLGTGIGVGISPISGLADLQVGEGGISSHGGASIGRGLTISGDGGNVFSTKTLYNPTNGLLIDICQATLTNMITVSIKGNGYGQPPIDSIFQVYHYNTLGNFMNAKQLNNGAQLPPGSFIIHENRVKLWVEQGTTYQTLMVTASGMNGVIYNPIISNSSIPSASHAVSCQVHQSWNNVNDGASSGLDADMLDGKHASDFASVSTESNSNGRWFMTGSGLLICAQNFSIANMYSDFTLTGTWVYPKAFSGAPVISVAPRTNLTDPQEIMNGTLSVLGDPTTTSVDLSWMKFSGAAFTSSSRKYLSIFAIGVPT